MTPNKLIDLFQIKRSDSETAIIEGVQALKHAARFGADITNVITYDIDILKMYLHELAPDISQKVLNITQEVSEETFQRLSPQPPRTKVISLANRKKYMISDIDHEKPIVF